MRPLLIALGAVMVVMGVIWTLQGINVLEGSAMPRARISRARA